MLASPIAAAIRGSPRSFTPSRLFTVAATGGWWDVSDLTTVSQDDAGAVPAAIDAVVGRVADKSGNGNHLLQATSGNRPILRRADSGGLYLEFDGVDNYLAAAFTFDQPIDRVSALRQISYTDDDRMFGSGSVGGGGQVFQFGTPTVYIFSGSPVGNSDAPLDAKFVLTERHNGASSRVAVNDLAYATGDAGAIGAGGITVGANEGGANPSNIRFYGAVALGREMTDAETADARAYFSARIAGRELGPECFEQPAFDASTGLTLTECTVSGGQLHFPGEGSQQLCQAASIETITGGDYYYELDVAATDDGGAAINVFVGDVSQAVSSGTGLKTGTITTAAATQTIAIREADGLTTADFNSFTVKRVI